MEKIRIWFYDDEEVAVENPLAFVRGLEACDEPRYFFKAADFARALFKALTSGELPHVAVIDITSDIESWEPVDLRPVLYDEAQSNGLNIEKYLDDFELADHDLSDWLAKKWYGIGLLALLRAANCRVRLAYTKETTRELTSGLMLLNLANYGVCPKSTDERWRGRLSKVIEELQDQIKTRRRVPDLYDVALLDDNFDEAEEGSDRRVVIQISAKNSLKASKLLTVEGDHAIVLSEILDGNGSVVSGDAVTNAINLSRKSVTTHLPYTAKDTAMFAKNFGITLPGEKGSGAQDRCRHDNDILCHWANTGYKPIDGVDGFDCFKATSGSMCPKRQSKMKLPITTHLGLEVGKGSDRRKVKELRLTYLEPLNEVFGPDFSGEKGFIHTVRGKGGGYALAGSIDYRDD